MPFPMLLALVAAAAPVKPAVLTTEAPLDGIVRCLRARLEPNGRVTAVNTAAGILLDYAFDAVGADGRVASMRIGFTIDDHGTERTIAATAANPADAPLALQYLHQEGARCAATDQKAMALHGAP